MCSYGNDFVFYQTEVEPEDIISGIDTLKFNKKLSISLPPIGERPELFLNWAKTELIESKTMQEEDKLRKYYNASICAKTAIECFIDWYLLKFMLNFTIRDRATMKEKLEILDSENLLGISFPLFDDTVFEPRNRGVHDFELIQEKEAWHSYNLVNLTLKHCPCPSESPIFYGDIVTCEGEEAFNLYCKNQLPFRTENEGRYFFIKKISKDAVVIDRQYPLGRISILTAHENGTIESRYSNIKGKFKSEQIRKVFNLLEKNQPKLIEGYNDSDINYISEVFFEYNLVL